MARKIGWPDPLILGSFSIVVSREQCHKWYERIEEGEHPLILGLLPPVYDLHLQHVGVQIRLSLSPPMDARRVWMFQLPRWVN